MAARRLPARSLVVVAASAAVTVVAAIAITTASPACRKATPPLPTGVAVRVGPVQRSGNTAATRYTAQIVPSTRVDLAFKVGGYVDSILQVPGFDGKPRALQEGDVVETGAKLASLRKTDYQQRIAEASAAVSQVYASYSEAQLDADRDAKLAAHGSLPGATADTSRSHRDSLRAAAEGAQARLSEARTALADTTLVSPMSGVVLKRSIEVGNLAAPGTIAFTIADVTSVKAVFGVPDVFLSQIALGATEKVETDAFPGTLFEGRVSRQAPSADARSRVFEVDVTIPNADGRLKAGMVAQLTIAEAAKADAGLPLVPLSAIVRPPSGQGFAVYVADAATGTTHVHARPVELGEYLGRVVPVKSGLTGTEQVVVMGAGLLSDGELVEIIPEVAPEVAR